MKAAEKLFAYTTPLLKKVSEPLDSTSKPADLFKNKMVLLAEDNMINTLVARKLLYNLGLTAVHVLNGAQAVERSKSALFDLILMDIHMPEMNGFGATVKIRDKENPNFSTPIFALTTDMTSEHQHEYFPYFTGFLMKPIEITRFYEALLNA